MTDRTLEERIVDGGETSRAIAELRARLEILERQPRYGVGFAADPSPTPEAPEAGEKRPHPADWSAFHESLEDEAPEAGGMEAVAVMDVGGCVNKLGGEYGTVREWDERWPSDVPHRPLVLRADAEREIAALTRRLESAEQRHADETRELRAHLTAAEASATHWVTKALRERPRVTKEMVERAVADASGTTVGFMWADDVADALNAALHPDKEADE
jgi:hypothetical protein